MRGLAGVNVSREYAGACPCGPCGAACLGNAELVPFRVAHDRAPTVGLVQFPRDGTACRRQSRDVLGDQPLAFLAGHVQAGHPYVEVDAVLGGLAFTSHGSTNNLGGMRHIALYLRISQDKRGRAEGVDAQERRGREYAGSAWPGLPVVIYCDNDLTAARDDVVRPAYERLREAIDRGEVAHLWTDE